MISMKKIKLFLLALLITAIPKSLWAYTPDEIVTFKNNIYKVLEPSGANASLMFVGTTLSGALVIPDKINDNKGITFTVTEIGSEVNYDCKDITSITLPGTIVKMGSGVFKDAKITKLDIPKSVRDISHTAWVALPTMPEFKVHSENPSFESDEKGVLYTKHRVELRTVPSNIMTKVTGDTYTIDSHVTSITVGAFAKAPDLKKIKLPAGLDKVEDIGWPSIAGTPSLEAFVMDAGNAKYEVVNGVLFTKSPKKLLLYPQGKPGETYTVPAGVEEITSYGIAGNPYLTSIDLKDVTKVKISALVNLPNLKTITIPKNLKKEGLTEGAFEGCSSLQAYKVAEGNPDFSADNGVLFSKNKDILYFYPIAKSDATYNIPPTVKIIADKAFQGASKLTSLVIPTSVEEINSQAFRQNYRLASVKFCEPSNLRKLANYSFWTCSSLKEVTLPSSITNIGKAFLACDSLETINVPANAKLTTIEEDAFKSNINLKHFNFLGECPLTMIGKNAFANLKKLTTFKMPKTVTDIQLNAFSGCSNLATVEFDPNADIQKIGAGAFADCGLQRISIPKKVKEIAKEAFRNCTVLKKIEVTEFTTSIDPEAFKYCDQLTEIKVSKDNTVYSSVGGYLLSKDKKTLILFPPGKANDKFTLLPPSIEKIGDNSFLDCRKLTNVTIPNKVKTIGKRAFGLCKNLKIITFLCDKMISADSINTQQNEMSFDDGTQTGGDNMFAHITINIRKELFDNYNNEPFYKRFQGGIQQSFTVEDEEYIAMSEQSVNMLSTKRKDHTFVIPTNITHNSKTYSVNLIGDYAFQKVTDDVKEVVVKKDVEYIGAQAFVTKKEANGELKSTVEKVFFIESNPTEQMLSTTYFELDETETNYNEFAETTKIYVKPSALDTYKQKWNKMVYDINTKTFKVSPFNFIDQISYKIPGVKITDQYGTFAREFDTDFSIYKQENNNKGVIAAFVAKDGDIRKGHGDYGTSAYNVPMRSIDEKGGVRDNYGYVPANTGVLLKVLDNKATPEDFYYAIGEKDDQTYTINNNIMHGITVNTKSVSASAANPIYVIQGGIFRKVTNTIETFTIHKAYAKIPGVPANAPVTFSFSDDDTTTGVMTIDAEKPIDNTYYNLNGQRVTNPQRGIYIQGGRKVIIK